MPALQGTGSVGYCQRASVLECGGLTPLWDGVKRRSHLVAPSSEAPWRRRILAFATHWMFDVRCSMFSVRCSPSPWGRSPLPSPCPTGTVNPMKSVLCLVGIFCASIALADDPPSIYHTNWIDLNKNSMKDVYEDSTQPVEKRVEDLLAQMTLEEKIGQLHQSIHDVDAVKIYHNLLQR